MKSTLLTAIVATSMALASATPKGVSFVKAGALSQRSIETAVPLTFTGQAFVDGPNVTLTGTAESIYNDLLAINPAYNEWDFPEYQERMHALGFTKESLLEHAKSHDITKLRKRGHTTCNPSGNEVGNWGLQCLEGIDYLGRLNGYCQAPAGPGGCARTSCSHGCGIFLCNDNRQSISVWCGNQVGDVYDIAATCERERTSYVFSLLGQIFRDGPPAWNTVVRTQNC